MAEKIAKSRTPSGRQCKLAPHDLGRLHAKSSIVSISIFMLNWDCVAKGLGLDTVPWFRTHSYYEVTRSSGDPNGDREHLRLSLSGAIFGTADQLELKAIVECWKTYALENAIEEIRAAT